MTNAKPLLTRDEVVAVLRRYLADEMSAVDLVQWSDDNEMTREYEPGYAEVLASFLFDFSSEVLNGIVTPERAEKWVEKLLSAEFDDDE